MKKLNRITIAIARIAEVIAWIGCAGMAALLAKSVANPGELATLAGSNLSIDGFDVRLVDAGGAVIPGAQAVLYLTGVLVAALTAMIYRNIHLIFEAAGGGRPLGEGATPFQPAVVRMVRQIGWFALAIPAAELLMALVGWMALGAKAAITVRPQGISFGLIVLCLSQFFAYGVKLQRDEDGLV